MLRHADLLVKVGATVRRGQALNVTFAQRIEKPPLEIPPDPAIALAAAEKRAALGKLKTLDAEEKAMRQTSIWPQVASSFVSRRWALQRAASQVVPMQPKSEPQIVALPKAPPTLAPFNAVIESIEWEPSTLHSEKGEKSEHSAQLVLIEVQR